MVETPMSATGPKVGGDDSRTHYRASAGMSAGGFTAKVSYAAADYVVAAFTDTQGNADPTDDVHHIAQHDAWTFASMLSYSAGAHTVGVEYVYSELDGGNLGDNKGAHETRGFLVGYSNAISGGLVWDARIAFIDADRLGKDKSRDITAFETGLGFSF